MLYKQRRKRFCLVLNLCLTLQLFCLIYFADEVAENLKPIFRKSHETIDCQMLEKDWAVDLELFMPLKPSLRNGLEEIANFSLPSMAIFWPPQNFRLVVVTDDDANKRFWRFTQRTEKTIAESGVWPNRTRVVANHCPIKFNRGWDRQQWIIFWADNFTTAEHIGIVDSDAIVITRVTRQDLFYQSTTRPIWRPFYGDPQGAGWMFSPNVTYRATGLLEPFNCMSFFPVIIKRRHLAELREHIRRHLGLAHFDEVFQLFQQHKVYCQFCIMCTYLYAYHRDEYFWSVRQRNLSFVGPFQAGMDPRPLDPQLLDNISPAVTMHWRYEDVNGSTAVAADTVSVFRQGICFSTSPQADAATWRRYCSNLGDGFDRFNKLNENEWIFEGFNYAWNASKLLPIHRQRLLTHDSCPKQWNHNLIDGIFERYRS